MEKMTRQEAEARITELLIEVGRVAKAYGSSSYLGCCLKTEDGYVSFNNEYWKDGRDENLPLERSVFDVDFDAEAHEVAR